MLLTAGISKLKLFTKHISHAYIACGFFIWEEIMIDLQNFTPWASLLGGMLIGLATLILILLNGRIAGISGILGGIGGFFYSVGIMDGNVNGHTGVAGFGFLALAVMIFGQWRPGKIFLGALFFAFLRTLAYSISLIPFLYNLGIDQTYYKMLPYVATMIVLAFTSKKSRAPKAEGIPYDKSLR